MEKAMAHIVRNLPWAVIDIDTLRGRVFFQQRWKYTWHVKPPLAAWTYEEKRAFHTRVDKHVWAAWANRVRFQVKGTSSFARRFSKAGVPINLDVRWVLSKPHWTVTVWKIAEAEFLGSWVNPATRKIRLDTNDFKTRSHCRGIPKVCTDQIPVEHEFGHAATNRGKSMDEYEPGHTNRNDQSSMMNLGNQLRDRHLDTIISEMNKMISDTEFSVRSIK